MGSSEERRAERVADRHRPENLIWVMPAEGSLMHSAVVFIGGEPPHPGVIPLLPADRRVVAADSGLDHALALGVAVDQLVGDLDSVSEAGLQAATRLGIPIERHPRDKDFTDTELAIRTALDTGARHLVVVSGVGDRLDHSLGALLALTSPELAAIEVEAWWGEAHVFVVRGPGELHVTGAVGDIVSLLPVNASAEGVTTSGLRFPLTDETLHASSSRGVSNELTATTAVVTVRRGALVAIVPHALRKVLP